ncbi:MAG TPA: M56 family metallopeptidase [Candidatus Acidoferrales bacterium]|nr:M56 family metallopeptidase [Candidatus Acidoferrales bacterium]
MTQALAGHLWQSTLFALAAGLMTAAFRGNRAQIRYWLWLSASLKFLVPFALLLNLGSYLETWIPAARQVASQITPAVSWTVEEFSVPSLSGTLPQPTTATAATSAIEWIPIALLALWLGGFATVAFIRFRSWLRIRAAIRASAAFGISETGISEGVEIRVSPCHVGPAVVGILRPVLLFPEGIAERLTPSELETVLAHELCHVRRRDNLFAAIHLIVEAVFWFHPLVWWISARLVEEREQACDEEVLSRGGHPEIYADAILNVCKFYVQSPLIFASGVSGASIRRRIEAIMLNRFEQLSRAKKLLLAGAGAAALVGPVVIGLLIGAGNVTVIQAQSAVSSGQKFEVAAIHPCDRNAPAPGLREMGGLGETGPSPNLVIKKCVTVMSLLKDAYIIFANGQDRAFGIQAPPIEGAPAWISSDRYTVEAKADGTPGQPMMLGPMMQSLLEDRFHLKLHRETRSGPAYELTVAKGGPKLNENHGSCAYDVPPAAVPRDPNTGAPLPGFAPRGHASTPGPGQPCHFIFFLNNGPNRLLVMRGMTLDEFSGWLFSVTGRTIVNKTGLTGKFDIRLEYLPDQPIAPTPFGGDSNESANIQPEATLLTAIQQQLGLKLVSVHGTRQIIVIDHIERPSGN